jgi:hypothetical protein
MVGKSKYRKRAAEHRLLINVNRNTTFQRKGMKIAMFLQIDTGKFCLFSYWLVAGIWAFPNEFPIPFKNFPEAAQ